MAEIGNLCMGCMQQRPEGNDPCPRCQFAADGQNPESALGIKTTLESRYVIGKMLTQNGEGITYIGYDKELDAPVRIREYCPAGLCQRTGSKIFPLAGNEETFFNGMQSFLELARALARMRGLSAIFPVYDIFEANGTAYYISETNECITLRDFLLRNGGSLTYEQARPLFMPILSTLSSLHAIGIYHRGISPETLVISKDGKLRLTEFSIADVRTARTDMVAQLFKGYAALEQYGFDGEQGPWTDIYGLAATLYRTIVGNPPPEATSRVTNDKLMMPPSVAETLPAYVMQGLINALAILPQERTKSVETFRDELSAAPNVISKQNQIRSSAPKQPKKKKNSSTKKYVLVTVIITVLIIAIVFAIVGISYLKKPDDDTTVTTPTMQETTTADYSDLYIDVNAGTIPKLVGQDYAALMASNDASVLKMLDFYDGIVIKNKKYSDDPAGTIISQSPKAGEASQKGDKIEVVVSLGTWEFEMPDIVGMEEKDAIIELMRFGFRYENITIVEKYDASASPRAVLETDPEDGETVNGDLRITVYINSLKEEITTTKKTKATTKATTRATTVATTAPTTPAPTTAAPTTTTAAPTTTTEPVSEW